MNDIYNNVWVTVNTEWGDPAMILTSDVVTSENHCRIASHWQKIGITGNLYSISFLTRYFIPWSNTQTRQNNHQLLISPFSSRTAFTNFVASPYFNLWHHAYVRYWHCDVIFVDCSCILKLTQIRYSLVDNNVNIDFPPRGIHGKACKKRVISSRR